MHLIDEAFQKAQEVLRLNVTERGFSACSIPHDDDPLTNYSSVWARDAAVSLMWSLPLGDADLIACGRRSLETILDGQVADGHLPIYVEVKSGRPMFGGIGHIAGIDGAMWLVIAACSYIRHTGDQAFAERYYPQLRRAMRWVRAHDSNNCGLIEIPEAADWTDLFPRSYNVLYDEVLWYRATVDFAALRHTLGHPIDRYLNRAARIRHEINRQFWPTPETVREGAETFTTTQFSLGRTRYLLAQVTPFGFSWRCDVYANIIASLYGVLDEHRARRVWRFLRQVDIEHPHPVRVLYPAIHPGEPDWRDYFLVNLQNLPHHYHNGGIWPFVGGLWVRFLERLGERHHAEQALESLAALCRDGVDRPWEFTEWAHGMTGRPMGKAFQAWSAASYIAAYARLQGEAMLEVSVAQVDEEALRLRAGLPESVTDVRTNLDQVPDRPPAGADPDIEGDS